MDTIISIGAELLNHYCYYRNYESNMTKFREEIEKLNAVRGTVQLLIEEAKNNGETILPIVENWLARADASIEEATKFLQDETGQNEIHTIKICPGLRSRYWRSKTAEEKIAEFVHLKAEGKFDRISVLKPPMWMNFSSTNTFLEFESRRDIEKDIGVALKQNEASIIGICGVGGVGKTTMAKRIARRVNEENSFEVVVMAVISQQPEIGQIQQEIAEGLGLKLGEQNLLIRAERLRTKLMGIKAVLIILDDVWERLNLEELGIPSQSIHAGCKLILTSRNRNTLTLMEDAKIFSLEVLSDEEAWILFIKYAGNSIDSSDMHQIAKVVAKECKGLPLALVTVGSALRGQIKSSWENALLVLQQSILTSIPEVLKDVYRPLLLSSNQMDDGRNCHSLVKRRREGEDTNICDSRTIKFRRSSNNLTDNVDSSNNNVVLGEEEEKRRARLMRNRESAQLLRQRKKHYVEELEDKVKCMESKIQELNALIAYMYENARLQQQLGGGMVAPASIALPPPPPGTYPQMLYPWMPCGVQPYLVKPQGSQVPLVPIPRLKPQQPVSASKTSKRSESKKKEKSEGKIKKVASVSFLGLMFFILLFGGLVPMVKVRFGGVKEAFSARSGYTGNQFDEKHPGRVLAVDGNVSRANYGDKYSGGGDLVNNKNHGRGHGGRGEPTREYGMDEFARAGNLSEPLATSLHVSRNDKLVKIDDNLIIHSVLASEKAMASRDDPAKNASETQLAVHGDLAPVVSVSGGIPPHLHTNLSHRQTALGTASVKDRLNVFSN